MYKATFAIITSTLLLAALPLAGADESAADCEDTQGWIGYTSTDFIRYTYENASATHPAIVDTCEGEHWDGQDTVHPEGRDGGSEAPCADVAETDPNTGRVYVVNCMESDPNAANSNEDPLALTPVGTRVAVENDAGRTEAYAAVDIAFVGRAAVYQGSCEGEQGLEGEESCAGTEDVADDQETRTAVYLRDNTPLNVLATAVSAPGLTKGYVSENDCDQETYQKGAESGDRTLCGRDNTAITVGALLP